MPKKILVIDDDELLLKMHKEKLERGGVPGGNCPQRRGGIEKSQKRSRDKKDPCHLPH